MSRVLVAWVVLAACGGKDASSVAGSGSAPSAGSASVAAKPPHDAARATTPMIVPAHAGSVRQLAFAGDRLVSAGGDGKVGVWDGSTGAAIASWRAAGELQGIAVANGRVATLAVDRARTNAAHTGSLQTLDIRDLDGGHVEPIALASVMPFGVGATRDGTLVVGAHDTAYRVAPGQDPVQLHAPPAYTAPQRSYSTAMLPGGVPVIREYAIALVDRGGRIAVGDCNGMRARLAANLDGTAIAVLESDRTLRAWRVDHDVASVGAVVLPATVDVTAEGAIGPGGTVALPTRSGIVLWEPTQPTVDAVELGALSAIAFAQSGAVALGYEDGRIAVWSSLSALRARAQPVTGVTAAKPLDAAARCRGELEQETQAFANVLAAGDPDDGGSMTKRKPGGDLNTQIAQAKLHPSGARIEIERSEAFDDTTLSADIVTSKIRAAYVPGLQRCYKDHLKRDPTAGGPLQLTFEVSEAGRVSKPRAKGVAIESCVTQQASAWRFPIPKDRDGDPTTATFQLVLRLQPSP
ncbi:MAG TPA: AgmX/PglI C-terminal domain-containing protein [Kofleriaceae bacterium]|nr:AgmX/PglI C-terminal domain-containing protein [Kofleriaceae bacterium]